jgi:hypothetical protein
VALIESKDAEFPAVPNALLEALEAHIPERCAELNMHEREIFFYAGQRSVVRLLRQVFNEQNEVS